MKHYEATVLQVELLFLYLEYVSAFQKLIDTAFQLFRPLGLQQIYGRW